MLENASPQISPSERAYYRKDMAVNKSSKFISHNQSDNNVGAGGVSNFMRLQKTENNDTDEHDRDKNGLETP